MGFFHQQHLIGLVQKWLINLLYIKQALRENLLLICSSEGFCRAQGLKTFSEFKKTKQGSKKLDARRFFKSILQNDSA